MRTAYVADFRHSVIIVTVALAAIAVACSSGGSPTPTPSPSPTPTPSPTPSPSPTANPREAASDALVRLSDLPTGFYDQGGDVNEGSSAEVLAIGTNSFGRDVTISEGLLGEAITVSSVAVVYSGDQLAKDRVAADYIEDITQLTILSTYGVTNPDVRTISFPSLGDDTVAVELVGEGLVAGQLVELGVRAVAIRYGNVVTTISTTSLGLGDVSEIERIALNLDTRLGS